VAGRIAEALGFSHAYAPANPRPFGGEWVHKALATLLNFSEGPAIVSRFPILDWEAQDLPRCTGRNGELRTLLSAMIQTPWGSVQAWSTHTRGDPCQTGVVADSVARRRNGLPGVLMGDFNAVEGSPALTPLRERAGVVDAFRAANPRAEGPTVWQRLEAAQSTVYRRVDYVFLVPGEQFSGRVVSSRVVLDRRRVLEDGRSLWPSDHYGVLAELDLFSAPLARPAADAKTGSVAAERLDTSGTRW
jgi:endonuclease/exonuclease/phosphatase family metal-dependent hydrolase